MIAFIKPFEAPQISENVSDFSLFARIGTGRVKRSSCIKNITIMVSKHVCYICVLDPHCRRLAK